MLLKSRINFKVQRTVALIPWRSNLALLDKLNYVIVKKRNTNET